MKDKLQQTAGIALVILIWSPLVLLLRESWPHSSPARSLMKPPQVDYAGLTFQMYTVQPRDSLQSIATAFDVPSTLIETYNRLGGQPLRAGEKILVPVQFGRYQ
jgi:hypothetical protein